MTSAAHNHRRVLHSAALAHVVVALLVIVAFAIALRVTTDAATLESIWDEPYMVPVVQTIVDDGWTREHLLDYEDTKGPAFFWPYAALAEIAGADGDDTVALTQRLRRLTLMMFMLGGLPFGLIASRAGLTIAETAAAAALYALFPYQAVLGQIFMSEPSFMLGLLVLILVFLWGFGVESRDQRPIAGPVVFGILLALLLHHRPHAVAVAGAVVFIATERDHARSWPWWLACVLAGLTRLPLFAYWGGLVSPEFQGRMGLGISLASLTYVAIVMLPYTVVFLWPAVMGRQADGKRRWVVAGAVFGALLGLVAVPNLAMDIDDGRARYMGITATTLRQLPAGFVLHAAVAVLAALGGAALAAVAALGFTARLRHPTGLIFRMAAWMIVIGWALYGMTRGAVFDRYVLPFVVLLPVLLVKRVPRGIVIAQSLVLFILMIALARSWLCAPDTSEVVPVSTTGVEETMTPAARVSGAHPARAPAPPARPVQPADPEARRG